MSFAHPEVFFLLLLVPLLLLGAILSSRKRGRAWKKLVASRLQHALVRSGSPVPRWISYSLALLGFALLITAFAGPNAGYEEENETIRGRNLLLAIDISRSMLADDESPNRLAAALASALEVLDHFPNDRIGVIAFSGSPFLQAPLTIDHGAVRETIQQLDPVMLQQLDADWLPRGGSDVAQAVDLAIDTLKDTGQKNNALIIFSDGEHHEGGYEDTAENAKEEGIPIFTAGFGTTEGAFLPDSNEKDGRFRDSKGNLVFSRLNTDGLRLLSRKTDGFYTRGSGRHFSGNLETAVERLDRYELEGKKHRVAIPRFQWFLLPSIVLLILSMIINTPWHILGRAAAMALAFLCLPQAAEARILPSTSAEKSLSRGLYKKAMDQFEDEIKRSSGERRARLQMGACATAYRLNDFDRATAAYSAALLSSDQEVQSAAHYSLGNSLFKLGEESLGSKETPPSEEAMEEIISNWNESLAHYEDALQLTPDQQQTKDNHALVKRRLDELKEEQEQEQQDQEKQEDGEENEENKEDGDSENKDEQKGENPDKGDKEKEDGEPENEGDDPKGNEPGDENEENQPPKNEGDEGDEEQPQGRPEPQQAEQQSPPRENESPEEHARRILSENADFQMTPLMRQEHRQKRPEKDW